MIKDIPPLDSEARMLLDVERKRPDPPPEVRARVRAGVLAAAVGLGASAPSVAQAAAGAGAVSGKAYLLSHPVWLLVAPLAVGAAIVAGVTTRPTRTERPGSVASTVAAPAPPPPAVEPPILAPADSAATVVDSVAARPRRPIPGTRADAPEPPRTVEQLTPTTGDAQLAVERTLLERARLALSSGQPREAIGIAAMHQSRFPQGRLAEDRERLRIQALIASGETTEARRRLADLERRFPDSIFLPDLRAALRSVPGSVP